MTEATAQATTALGVIETDAFCEGCGFNLHTQHVWRDDRLGIAVCRCPECGKHHAAGMRSTSTAAWARRLALVGLLIYVLIALSFVVGSFFLFFGIDVAAMEMATQTRVETVDGKAVQFSYGPPSQSPFWFRMGDSSQTPLPLSDVVNRTTLIPTLGGPDRNDVNFYRSDPPLIAFIVVGTTFTLATFLDGCIVAAFAWFWRRGWSAVWLLMPFLAAVVVLSMQLSDQQYTYMGANRPRREGESIWYAITAGMLVCQCVLLGAGLLLGRPIARFALTVLIPPKSRQLFAFLWHRDGLTMPSAATASTLQ